VAALGTEVGSSAAAYGAGMTIQPSEFTATLTSLTIGDVMHPEMISCRPQDDLGQVAATMVAHGIHATLLEPLTNTRPLIVTDLDLVRAAVERPSGTRAGELTSEPAPTLDSGTSVSEAVAKMAELYVTHLIATDEATAALSGVISSFDIVALIGGHRPADAWMLNSAPAASPADARSLDDMLAREVMHPGIVTCAPDAPLWTVARAMAEHRIHCVAVAGVGGAGAHGRHFGWGLIDAMELVLAAHSGTLAEAAATIASASPPAVNDGDTLERAARLMINDGARHVVVIGPSGLPSGMISTLDVMRVLAAGA
jgi:CBS domain-containing protein